MNLLFTLFEISLLNVYLEWMHDQPGDFKRRHSLLFFRGIASLNGRIQDGKCTKNDQGITNPSFKSRENSYAHQDSREGCYHWF
jgi:hypothetical protein